MKMKWAQVLGRWFAFRTAAAGALHTAAVRKRQSRFARVFRYFRDFPIKKFWVKKKVQFVWETMRLNALRQKLILKT
jgi:hypothetical protein